MLRNAVVVSSQACYGNTVAGRSVPKILPENCSLCERTCRTSGELERLELLCSTAARAAMAPQPCLQVSYNQREPLPEGCSLRECTCKASGELERSGLPCSGAARAATASHGKVLLAGR